MRIGRLISPIRCKRENEQKNTIKLIKNKNPTTYRQGQDKKTYERVKAMYTPADFDASSVREITPEQHLSYQKAKEQALQEETEHGNNA